VNFSGSKTSERMLSLFLLRHSAATASHLNVKNPVGSDFVLNVLRHRVVGKQIPTDKMATGVTEGILRLLVVPFNDNEFSSPPDIEVAWLEPLYVQIHLKFFLAALDFGEDAFVMAMSVPMKNVVLEKRWCWWWRWKCHRVADVLWIGNVGVVVRRMA